MFPSIFRSKILLRLGVVVGKGLKIGIMEGYKIIMKNYCNLGVKISEN